MCDNTRCDKCGKKKRTSNATDDGEDLVDPNSDPSHPVFVNIEQINEAEKRIAKYVQHFPCKQSHLSGPVGMDLYIKPELFQQTGSFKERGVFNTMLMLDENVRKKGVVAASTGNHAQAIAYASKVLGTKGTVIMPQIAPTMKRMKCEKYGAEVIMEGMTIKDAYKYGLKLAKERGMTYINGYDHPGMIMGSGTIAKEILTEVPDPDCVVVSAGGGALVAGIATTIKSLNPRTCVVSVQGKGCVSFTESLKLGQPIEKPTSDSLADALRVPIPGVNSIHNSLGRVDKKIIVDDELITMAILRLIELDKIVCEGGGAAPLAAILSKKLDYFKGKKVVLIISGGNIDTNLLKRALDRSLAAEGRCIHMKTKIGPHITALHDLLSCIASKDGIVKYAIPENGFVTGDIFGQIVKCIIYTRDWDHALVIQEFLRSKYEVIEFKEYAMYGKPISMF